MNHRRTGIDQLSTLCAAAIVAVTLIALPVMSQTNTFPASGPVGIGTTTPAGKLQVKAATDSSLAIFSSTPGFGEPGLLMDSLLDSGNLAPYFFNGTKYLFYNGRVGIGAGTNPQGVLDVNPGPNSHLVIFTSMPGFGQAGLLMDSLDDVGGLSGYIFNGSKHVFWTGNVGIGVINPTVALDVNGSVNVSGNIAAKYQDVAEWVPASETMEPGTVVVLNPEKANQVMPATHPYDTLVAGVVSANPGLSLGVSAATKEQIATVGRVQVKATANGHPIHIGDLLVTSGKSGVAMKSEPMEIQGRSFHQPGTIIGKALEPLEKGEGKILVLLSLQ